MLTTLKKISNNKLKKDLKLYQRYSNIIVANLVK
jgi:hypothetical protein